MMSEEGIQENSVVTSDSMVSLSKDAYQTMLRTISGQNQKIHALKNLHQLVQSKDNELRSTREKAQNLQAALDRAEMRLVSQIRLAAAAKSPPCQSTLEADSVACEISPTENEQVMRVKKSPQATYDDRPHVSTDIEMDGACLVERSARIDEYPSISSKPFPSSFSSDISGSFAKSSVSLAQLDSSCSDVKISSQNTSNTKAPFTSVLSGRGVDSLTSLDAGQKISLSGNTTLRSFGATGGVSKDLLDKLMQQNARLRKVIKDILEQQGTTIEGHLERNETKDVVEQLREELRLSKQQNEKLKQLINTKDKGDIQKKYTEQNASFQKAGKTIVMLQAMVDAYGKEYEKLQQENKMLKGQLSTTVLRQETELDETKGCSDKDQLVKEQEIEGNSLKHQYDEILVKLKASESECDNLRTQCQGLQEMLTHYKKEMIKVEQLNKRIVTLESEKQMLESQVVVFQEDFATEHKDYLEKQQHYETTLAKHQDWIRRLVAEAQKSRSSLEEEKAKRMMAESSCRDVEERFRKFVIDSRSTSTPCRNVDDFRIARRPLNDLQVDNAAEASASLGDLCHDPRFSAPRLSDDTNEEVEGVLVCPRCEREFERKDEQKFRDHIARCTDD